MTASAEHAAMRYFIDTLMADADSLYELARTMKCDQADAVALMIETVNERLPDFLRYKPEDWRLAHLSKVHHYGDRHYEEHLGAL